MLPRSNSNSHIPLRTNLFGYRESGIPGPSGGTLRRSQSISNLRLNQNENNANRKSQRISSLDRKSSLTRLSKLTPLNKQGRVNSATKTTPGSSTISQRHYRLRLTQSTSAQKERKTIQKLASDKKWVDEQYAKVRSFILESNLFDINSFDSTNNIKPPSIKTFVHVTSIFFKAMFPNVNLNNENYKVVIPEKLAVLRYPGKVTNSTLKTVYTMSSWPQVIGMWGFLIDKIYLGYQNERIFENLDFEDRQKAEMAQTCWNFVVGRHALFNAQKVDDIPAANAQYVQQLTKILDVDPQEFSTLRARVLEREEYKKELDKELNDLLAKKEDLESQISKIQKEIKHSNESLASQKSEIDKELNSLQKAIDKAKFKKEDITVNIDILKEAIKVQPCTHNEKLELLKKIQKLENKIEIIKGKISHAQKIKNEFDEKLNNERSKLQNKVIEWNRSLLKVSIKKPHLKKLMLRETGFHKLECLDEIKEMVEQKVLVEKEVVENIGKIEGELKDAFAKKKSKEVEIHNFQVKLEQLNKDIHEKTEVKNLLDEQIIKVQLAWEQEKKAFIQGMNDPQMIKIIESKTAEMLKLKSELNTLETEIVKLCKNITSFFTDLGLQVEWNIQEMRSIMKSVEAGLVQKAKAALEYQKERVEILKHLGDMSY